MRIARTFIAIRIILFIGFLSIAAHGQGLDRNAGWIDADQSNPWTQTQPPEEKTDINTVEKDSLAQEPFSVRTYGRCTVQSDCGPDQTCCQKGNGAFTCQKDCENGTPAPVPVNAGLAFLVIAGIGYGAYRLS